LLGAHVLYGIQPPRPRTLGNHNFTAYIESRSHSHDRRSHVSRCVQASASIHIVPPHWITGIGVISHTGVSRQHCICVYVYFLFIYFFWFKRVRKNSISCSTESFEQSMQLSCVLVLRNNQQSSSWSITYANGGGGSWPANRRTPGQLSFEGSWILLLNNNSAGSQRRLSPPNTLEQVLPSPSLPPPLPSPSPPFPSP